MQRLPLYEQVREARARSTEANDAASHLQKVEAAAVSVGIHLAQATRHPMLDDEVAGDTLIEELAERWEALSDLGSSGPRHDQSYAHRLQAREAQLQAARRVLSPLAAEADHLHHELHHKINDQALAMERAGLTEAIAELAAINEQRVTLSHELVSVSTRATRLQPAFSMLDTFVDRLIAQTARAADGNLLQATLALHLAASLAQTIALAFDELELDATIPEAPVVPEEIVPAEAYQAAAEVRDGFVELRAVIETLHRELTTREAELQQKNDELIRRIIERTG